MTEQHSLRSSSLWGGVDAPDERQEEARTPHSIVGHAEPTTFSPYGHSTPGLKPRFTQSNDPMLLGKKTIVFVTPDEGQLKVSPTNGDVVYT